MHDNLFLSRYDSDLGLSNWRLEEGKTVEMTGIISVFRHNPFIFNNM